MENLTATATDPTIVVKSAKECFHVVNLMYIIIPITFMGHHDCIAMCLPAHLDAPPRICCRFWMGGSSVQWYWRHR